MEIEEKVIKNTTKCRYNMECLINKNHFCLQTEVIRTVNNNILFVVCSHNECNYKVNFGCLIVCTCSVRNEIFDKYNL